MEHHEHQAPAQQLPSGPADPRDMLAEELELAQRRLAGVLDLLDPTQTRQDQPLTSLLLEPLRDALEAVWVARAMVREWPPVAPTAHAVDAQGPRAVTPPLFG